MPPVAALAPILGAVGGIGGTIASGIGGATNTRPPSLDPTQRSILDQLLPQLFQQVQGTPKIDPIQQQLMYGNIAQSQTGANNAVTNSLVSRGLGQSGILGSGLMQVANQAQSSRNASDLGLQQQAVQLQQQKLGDILGLLGVSNIPGQSGVSGFFNGIAPMLAFMGAMNSGNSGGGGSGSGGSIDTGGY